MPSAMAYAAERVRCPEDGAALLLAAVFWRAFRDLRNQQYSTAAACFLNTRAAREWAAAIDVTLPADITPVAPRRRVRKGETQHA